MKRIFTATLTIFFVFILSCDTYVEREMEMWNVTITLHNNSDYNVTDINIWSFVYPFDVISVIGKGEKYRLTLSGIFDKDPSPSQPRISIEYQINGEQFNGEHQKDAIWFPTPYGILRWEENGVWYELTLLPCPCNVYPCDIHDENYGYYVSPHILRNGAHADIFIYNDGYRIELTGGRWHDPNEDRQFPLPPHLRP